MGIYIGKHQLLTMDGLEQYPLINTEVGSDNDDLHIRRSTRLIEYRGNAQSLLNKPSEFKDGFCLVLFLSPTNKIQIGNWGTVILFDIHNNSAYSSSVYSNDWSEWKKIY